MFLALEAEIPDPHDFKTITIGRRPVIVSRAADGGIHALLNRCTHRGSLVCVEDFGNAKRFRCPYHGWSFGSDGKLVAVTVPGGYGPGFDRGAHNLGRFPRIESYHGFIFGTLNPDAEPFLDWLGPARKTFDWCIENEGIGPRGVRVVKGVHYAVGCNWKHQNDNNGDAYHAPFLHHSTAKMNQLRHGSGKGLDHVRGDQTPMYVQYLGHGHKLIDQRPAITSTWARARPVPGSETHAEAMERKLGKRLAREQLELVGRTGINLVLYPNFFLMGNGSYAVYDPVSVNLTHVRYYTTLCNDAPEDLNTLRVRFAEDFNNVGVRDDNEGLERIQYALETIPEMAWVDLSRGLGTDRESIGPDGVVTGNVMDETGIRGAYDRWKELMGREVRLAVA